MKFCTVCDNLLSLIKNKEVDKLQQYCKSCKKSFDCEEDEELSCVFSKDYTSDKVYFELFINKYTKYDPTLPHTDKMTCQNEKCPTHTNTDIKSDIVYIRHDEQKMKYIYLCSVCDKAWIHPEYQKTLFI